MRIIEFICSTKQTYSRIVYHSSIGDELTRLQVHEVFGEHKMAMQVLQHEATEMNNALFSVYSGIISPLLVNSTSLNNAYEKVC